MSDDGYGIIRLMLQRGLGVIYLMGKHRGRVPSGDPASLISSPTSEV
ncbi:hypothetical protein [Geomonas propionica]|uniref:Uncharacterized protein n=1 Tax=Geomonas propionica TaxID=2798582 RepID=A0ABS0YPQ1_9BACT|nr:hypothetical protein [Geomonas propionica]MBJ6799900.1 hypothetical protein [Geomonas propionica]